MTASDPRRNGTLAWHPIERLGSPRIYFDPPIADELDRRGNVKRPGRPAMARLSGPLGGSLPCDPERLRFEARRLVDAADTLEAMRRPPVDEPTLFDLEPDPELL